jgi:two-component system NtrC family sensor kinase
MQQVIINIMLNAEQAMAGAGVKGKIIIRTNLISGYLNISLTDNGPGIAPEHISKIFDPFFTTKEVGTGSGLGLPICYGIIAEHKGTIRVESELGKGATFIIELPLAPDGQVEPVEKLVVGEGTIIKKKIATGKVLVVDDEPLIRDILRRFLIRAGNTVESVSSGNEALGMLAEGKKYELFLVDVKMPGMSGNEFYSILQQKHPDMVEKVVFITGDIVTRETNDFLVATGRPHLAKPFNYDELINITGSILGGGNEPE